MPQFTFSRPKLTPYTSEQVALLLGVSGETVRRWSLDGIMPDAFIWHPRVAFWWLEEIRAWEQAGRPIVDPLRNGTSDPPDECE